MANKYLDDSGLSYFWTKLKAYFQEKLISGTNIKTINSQSLLGSGNMVISGGGSVLDFYPVGSYYETSDADFDPNVSWGGTWIKETSGQVHVSAGDGYAINGALSNTSDGGSPYIQAHTHSDNFTLPNHTHGTGGTASEGTDRFMTMGSGDGWGASRRTIKNGTGASLVGNFYNEDHPMTRKANTGNPNSNPSISGSVGAVSGATTGQGGNMPPFIIVNRWHRTA